MQISSEGIINGVIEDKYGKRGNDFINNVPALSLPFSITDAPTETKSFVVVLKDDDAVPVAGFPWIHWLAANITDTSVPENASRSLPSFVQGVNSWNMPFYGGMMPPNAPHRYDLYVYALDKLLPLKDGFTYEELKKAMRNNILAETKISGTYDN